MIYLDWAATSKPDEYIYSESQKAGLKNWGNPSSLHDPGKEARYTLESYRSKTASLLGCRSDQLILTSGGTESNNLAVLSLLMRQVKGEALLSSLEHPSVSEPMKSLSRFDFKVRVIPPGEDGLIKAKTLVKRLTSETRMVAIMGVHNTTGAIQPVQELVKEVRKFEKGKRPIHFHCDMVQAAGKIPFNLSDLDVDSASFSGHKLGAPRGAGLLYLKRPITVLNFGGGQEQNLRSGTESLQNMAAMYLALEKYGTENCESMEKVRKRGNYLTEELKNRFASIQFNPPARIESPENFVPAIVNFSLPPLPGEVLHRVLDTRGVALSHGSACAANGRKKPEDLHSMGIHPKIAHCSIRVSLGPETTEEELDHFLNILAEETEKLGIN